MDMPGERKVHTHPIPRTGGLAIFISFGLALTLVNVANTDISKLLVLNQPQIFLMAGVRSAFSPEMMVVLSTLGERYMTAGS